MNYYSHIISKNLELKIKDKSNELENIFQKICAYFGLNPAAVRRKNRKRELVNVRHIFFFEANKRGYSFNKCGNYFSQTHATALHGVRNVENIKELKNYHKKIFINQ